MRGILLFLVLGVAGCASHRTVAELDVRVRATQVSEPEAVAVAKVTVIFSD